MPIPIETLGCLRCRVAVLLMFVVWQPLAHGGQDAAKGPPDVNVVEQIRAVPSGIEVRLRSSRDFPVRDEIVVMRIGSRDFLRSRSPEDGSLSVLIFTLTPEEFASLADGDPITVRFGKGPPEETSPRERWNFGKLNKALLGK